MTSGATAPHDPSWDDVKRDFVRRTFGTDDKLCANYRIHRSTLYRRARREGWTRSGSRIGGKQRLWDPLARLKRVARSRVEALEKDENAAAIEKLAALVRLMERIASLEQKEKAAERARKPLRAVNDARRLELARRLDAIRRQLELERDRQPADG